MTDILASQVNKIILGDFNIYGNDENDPDAMQFIDTMEALGLKQYINKLTHKIANNLDLIFTVCTSNIRLDKIRGERLSVRPQMDNYVNEHLQTKNC